jgi:hypothetical protein
VYGNNGETLAWRMVSGTLFDPRLGLESPDVRGEIFPVAAISDWLVQFAKCGTGRHFAAYADIRHEARSYG